jgi:hypothetical protein
MKIIKSKKIQASVYIGIVLLISLLVLFQLIFKLRSAEVTIAKTESVTRDYEEDFLFLSTVVAPYSTTKKVSLEELMGVYVCYGNDTIDYGNGLTWNFVEMSRNKFNEIFGKNHWILQLYIEEFTKPPELAFVKDPTGSITGSDIQKIKTIMEKIPGTKVEQLFNIDEIGNDVHEFNQPCEFGGTMPDENWGGAVAYMCENGPPRRDTPNSPFYFDGWKPTEARAVFIASDEASCSGIPCATDPDPSPQYVDKAISVCNDNNVKVFFIWPSCFPPEVCCPSGLGPSTPIRPESFACPPSCKVQCEDGQTFDCGCCTFPVNRTTVERMCNETGGFVVDLDNAEEAAEKITSLLNVTTGGVKQIDSKTVTNLTSVPEEAETVSYDFVFPLMCTEKLVGKARLIYSSKNEITNTTI